MRQAFFVHGDWQMLRMFFRFNFQARHENNAVFTLKVAQGLPQKMQAIKKPLEIHLRACILWS